MFQFSRMHYKQVLKIFYEEFVIEDETFDQREDMRFTLSFYIDLNQGLSFSHLI